MLPTIPAERLRLHIAAWLHDGHSVCELARAAHVSERSLREIVNGQAGVETPPCPVTVDLPQGRQSVR